MRLAINSVQGKGNLDRECVLIDVTADVDDLNRYVLCDSTFTEDGAESNDLRHFYWFDPKRVKKNDRIMVLTRPGANTTRTIKSGGTTHIFYWGLRKTVWNKRGDVANLLELADINKTPV